MKKLIIISNLEDSDARQEDIALGDLLKKHFEVKVLDLFDDSIFSQECLFLIRNIWGRADESERAQAIYQNFEKRGIKYSIPFVGKGDQKGKRYLIDLYNLGHKVIPTFADYAKALQIKSTEYLLKPIYGGSGKGIISVSKENLSDAFDKQKYIIQPKLEFASELSFFFIDCVFQYALKTRNSRWDLEIYAPTPEELALAQEFIQWNQLQGIQRIDFLKTNNNKLLLLEVEDWCPYLSLLDVDNFPAEALAAAIAQSMNLL